MAKKILKLYMQITFVTHMIFLLDSTSLEQELVNYGCGSNPTCSLFWQIKFYWKIVTSIHLAII